MKKAQIKKARPIKTLTELLNALPDEEASRKYLEQIIGVRCVYCYQKEVTELLNKDGSFRGYKCRSCNHIFNNFTGTEFEHSHVPFRKWLIAIFLYRFSTYRKISSHQLGRDLGLTQKTALDMLRKIKMAGEPNYKEQMTIKRKKQYNIHEAKYQQTQA